MAFALTRLRSHDRSSLDARPDGRMGGPGPRNELDGGMEALEVVRELLGGFGTEGAHDSSVGSEMLRISGGLERFEVRYEDPDD